jgi:uncharacterized coiled-coil DUF342 family protein
MTENNTTTETAKNFENSKSKIDKLEKEIEKLKVSLEKNDEKLTELIKSRDSWKECAEYYAEKFQLAYKGFLMTQGKSETESHQESLKVLDKISFLK